MASKVETADKERDKHIKKDMEEMKRRYETANDNLWNLETKMDTRSRDQAESSCAIQSKVNALLKDSIAQEKTVADKTEKQPRIILWNLNARNRNLHLYVRSTTA